MGARPIAALNSLRFGDLKLDRTRYLLNGAVEGIAFYGNTIGVPTVAGETWFNPSYNGNPLVNAMCVGIIEDGKIFKGVAKGKGNTLMAVGAKTGRDGIHGATFASEEISEDTESKRPAVQVGDPFTEKLLLEACLELMQSDAVVGIQDMGAAGLTSSSCEMASRGESGIDFDVTLVPQREEGMTPYEILLSESQERMLVAVHKGREDEVFKIFEKWELDAAIIGTITDDNLVTVRENGEIVAQIPSRFLTDEAPVYYNEAKRPEYLDQAEKFDPMTLPEPADYTQALIKLLQSDNICSKEWVYRHFDTTVGTSSVIRPGSDAAVLRLKNSRKGLAMCLDCNSRYVYLNPFEGGKIAVAESARNVVCSGAEPVAITNCLNFGNPDKPEVFYTFKQAVTGMAEACRALDTPVTGGNVSLYNESPDGAVYPTPTVGMMGVLEDIDQATTSAFKNTGDLIYLIGQSQDELGASEYLANAFELNTGRVPKLDLAKEKQVQKTVLRAIREKLIKAAHDCSEGGLAVALSEMAVQADLGFKVELNDPWRSDVSLFGESQSRIIVSLGKEQEEELLNLLKETGVEYSKLGEVTPQEVTIFHQGKEIVKTSSQELSQAWKEALPWIMKNN
jgi:phosphoribosylformylglycinamidine synthase